MLTSLLLTLAVDGPVRLPPFLGRAGRAVLLKLIASDSPGLAERLHAPNERRPYTCSTIWGAPTRDGSLIIKPDNQVYLRYTGLTPEVSAQLQRLAEEPPSSIDVEGVTLYRASGGKGYVIVSSQGSSEFKVYRREGRNAFVGTFRVRGAADTDGVDVTRVALGRAFPKGLLACHSNVTVRGACPVLLVPWERIAASLTPALKIDTSPAPRL